MNSASYFCIPCDVKEASFTSQGMQKYEALFMITIFQGFNILTNSLSAFLVLQEMQGAPQWKVMGYFACIIGILFGVILLALCEREQACPKEDIDMDLSITALEEGLAAASMYNETIRNWIGESTDLSYQNCQIKTCLKTFRQTFVWFEMQFEVKKLSPTLFVGFCGHLGRHLDINR